MYRTFLTLKGGFLAVEKCFSLPTGNWGQVMTRPRRIVAGYRPSHSGDRIVGYDECRLGQRVWSWDDEPKTPDLAVVRLIKQSSLNLEMG
jgi:hypothetical protein